MAIKRELQEEMVNKFLLGYQTLQDRKKIKNIL